MPVRRQSSAPQVFINAPFDAKYKPLFDAIVFTVVACGYKPRCGLESSDSGTPRIGRLIDMIKSCDLSIHDLSLTQLDADSGLPRFNMPFEFGVFVGARSFGGPSQNKKICYVLAEKQFIYQRYISDIAGQDIGMHNNEPVKAIQKIREFLRGHANSRSLAGASVIVASYERFKSEVPRLSALPQFQYDAGDLHFLDYCQLAEAFLLEVGWGRD